MSNSIVFIDSNISDITTILASLDATIEVHVLNTQEDGLLQIASILQGRGNLEAIHLISHGNNGALSLGTTELTTTNLGSYKSALTQIGASLSATGDILLYGCDVAQGDSGLQFIEQLGVLTGADIAASDDLTGAADKGGDWVLEASTGAIEAAAFSAINYTHTLAVVDPIFLTPTTNPFGLTNVGTYASPTFIDIDGDGDLDAFIGDGTGITQFYNNTGTASNPVFSAPTTNPFGLTNMGIYASPTLVDIDNDGDLDAFIGGSAGNSNFYRNTGTVTAPVFSTLTTNPFGLTNVGTYASPTFIDIDGDGDLDAFIGDGTGITQFYNNTGTASNPVFSAPTTNPFGLTNMGIYASPTLVDIDNDGDLDAFIGGSGGNTHFYRNTGTVTSPVFSVSTTNPFGLTDVGTYASPTFIDIDGDGDLDAFIGDGDGITHFYRNNRVPTATNNTVTLGEDSSHIFTAAEFGYADPDSDAMASIKITSLPTAGSLKLSGSNVILNQVILTASIPNLTFTPAINGNGAGSANFNFTVNDGALDSISANTITFNINAIPDVNVTTGITPVETGATGTFTITLDSPAPVGGLVVNYDLTDSTATLTTDYTVTAGTNVSNITANTFTIAAGATSATLNVNAVADINSDPNETITLNINAGSGYQTVTTYDNAVTFLATDTLATGTNTSSDPRRLSIGDINGDGLPDFVVANHGSSTVSIFTRNASNTDFNAKVDKAAGTGTVGVTLADFNYDGKLDIATANNGSDNISILINTSTSTTTSFNAAINIATGAGTTANPNNIESGDFNNDGKMDLAVTNQGGHSVSIFLRNTSNITTTTGFDKTDYAITGTLAADVVVADFNGDKNLDFAVADNTNSTADIFLNASNGTSFSQIDCAVGMNPYGIGAGDFNGDGKSDLVVGSSAGSVISVFLRNNAASTGFNPKTDYQIGSTTHDINVGDVNNDGKLDLVVNEYQNDAVAVLLGNGDGTFNNATHYIAGNGTWSASIADINSDGKQDILAVNATAGTVSVLQNNTNPTVTKLTIGDAPSFKVSDGKAVASGSANEWANSAVIQSDGKIVTLGNVASGSNYFELMRYNADGSLDTSFGIAGKVTDLSQAGDSHDIALQADGKIIVTGTNATGTAFRTLRYDSNGYVDATFGNSGIAVPPPGATYISYAVAIQSNGDIVVGGSGSASDFTLVDYLSSGTLNNSVDTDGQFGTDMGGTTDEVKDIAIQTDGKIVAVGHATNSNVFAVARFNVNGSLDVTFDGSASGNGKVTTDVVSATFEKANAVVIQTDGKIIAAGYVATNGDDFAVVRYNTNGVLDSSFGNAGKVITNISAGSDVANSIALQTDGKILVAGYTTNTSTSQDFALVRYNTDGSPDTSFGNGGIVITNISSNDVASKVLVQTDGKIVLVGYSGATGSSDVTVVRYNPDGSLDLSFDAPNAANTLSGTFNYTENAAAIALDTSVKIFDYESSVAGNYNATSLTLARNGGANAQDVFGTSGNLSLSAGNAILSGVTMGTFTNSNGSLVLNFNINATEARVDEALSSLTYSNNSDNPSTSAVIDWTFSDGSGASTTGSTTVNITAVNDAPTFTGLASSVATGTEDTETAITFANLQTQGNEADVDGTVSAFIVKAVSTGTLKIGTSAGTATAWAVGSNDIVDATHIAYWTPAVNANGTLNAFTVTAKDGTLESATAIQAQVSVTAVNDAPTATNVNTAETYTEDTVLNLTDIVISDIDSANITATLTLSNTAAGSLNTATSGAVTSSYNSSTGVWSVSGALADVNILLASVTFTPSLNFNSNFTLATSVSDGVAAAITGSKSFTGTAVNDAPTGSVSLSNSYPQRGETLTVSHTLADIDGLGTLSYTWFADGQSVATGNSYSLSQSDIGKVIGVTASYTDAAGTNESVSSTLSSAVVAPSVNITPSTAQSTGENGATASYSVQLSAVPLSGQNVVLTFSSSDSTEGTIDAPILTFTTSNWNTPQTLLVRGVDDHDNDGNIAYSVNANISTTDVPYQQVTVTTLALTNLDDGRDVPVIWAGDSGVVQNDTQTGLDGNDVLYGYALDDSLSGGAGNDTIVGGNDNDKLFGDADNDMLSGESGVDYLEGGTGNDSVDGGTGNDALFGNADDDVISGATGIDYMEGGTGNDSLDGGIGIDIMNGGSGNDTYYLGSDALDSISDSGSASDTDSVIVPYLLARYTLPSSLENGELTAGTRVSNLIGNASNNSLTGNNGNNTLSDTLGNDTLSGNGGNDTLEGGSNDDSLDGGAGNDVLNGGVGNDTLTGGTGLDMFRFFSALNASSNLDSISDFSVADDSMQLAKSLFTVLSITGVLNSAYFKIATAAADNNDYIFYNQATGALFYDADANSVGMAVQIATLGTGLSLTNADFIVI